MTVLPNSGDDKLPRNSASRVLRLLSSAATKSSAGSALDAWSEVLGTTELEDEERLSETVILLADLKRGIDNSVRLLRKRGYSNTVIMEPAARAHAATAVSNLSANWGPLKERLSPDTLLHWRMFAESIDVEDWAVPEEELNEISSLLSQLRSRLSKEGIPSELRDFVEQQLSIVEHALRRYAVRGYSVFSEVITAAMAVWAEYADLDLDQDRETRNLLERVWSTIVRWAPYVKSMEAIVRAGAHLLQLGSGNPPHNLQ